MFGKPYYLWKSTTDKLIPGLYEDLYTLLAFIGIKIKDMDSFSNASMLLELGMINELVEEVERNNSIIREVARNREKCIVVIDPYEYRAVIESYPETRCFITLQSLLLDKSSKLPEAETNIKLMYFPSFPERELGIDRDVRRLLTILGFHHVVSEEEISGAEPFIEETAPGLAMNASNTLLKEAREKKAGAIITSSPLIFHRLKKLIGRKISIQLLPLTILHYT